VTIVGASELQQTNFMTRLNFDAGKKPDLDPYVAVDVDEVFVERTLTKQKTRDPEWQETFNTELLRSAEEIGFTVFHDATVHQTISSPTARFLSQNLSRKKTRLRMTSGSTWNQRESFTSRLS